VIEALVAILGLVIGSFLNVVIYRLPKQMEHDWALQCGQTPADPRPGLVVPGSRCPQCGHALAWFENIPLLSFIVQRGRCRACAAPIAVRYPLVELAAAGLAMVAVRAFGLTPEAVLVMVFLWTLLALAVIDARTLLLPDRLTLGLLWAGLLANALGYWSALPLPDAVLGALAGYASLAAVAWGYAQLTGREGMGLGDAKLLAALGAWLGWLALPLMVLLASLLALLVGGLALWRGRADRHTALPFGPFLALAGGLAIIWGREWMALWLN
jgi:leader peptidase (prepilin peptidase)/N-methyltransferase